MLNDMIRNFADKHTAALFEQAQCHKNWRAIRAQAERKLTMLDSATCIDDLRSPPGNRLEALKGDRQGQWSIRINSQYRICFRWDASGAQDVEICDYH
jgi:proteic killer suppression protein